MSPLGHLTLLKESVWRTAGGLSPEASGCAWEGGTPEASACKSGGPGRPQGARGGGPGGLSVCMGARVQGSPRLHVGWSVLWSFSLPSPLFSLWMRPAWTPGPHAWYVLPRVASCPGRTGAPAGSGAGSAWGRHPVCP